MHGKRLTRERDTITKMIKLYCQAKHMTGDSVCFECQELLDYAVKRLKYCRFGDHKPVCAKCPIHCYQTNMRMKVVDVMRYAGPRMIYRHPILAIQHVLDSFRKV